VKNGRLILRVVLLVLVILVATLPVVHAQSKPTQVKYWLCGSLSTSAYTRVFKSSASYDQISNEWVRWLSQQFPNYKTNRDANDTDCWAHATREDTQVAENGWINVNGTTLVDWLPSSAIKDEKKGKYIWCGAVGVKSHKLYYSETFQHAVDSTVTNAFRTYVSAHYDDGDPDLSAFCSLGSNTSSEAKSERDRDVIKRRTKPSEVVFTNWTYEGS
jgi:hypothetical protein